VLPSVDCMWGWIVPLVLDERVYLVFYVVGVRSPEASELQRESIWNSNERKGMILKARQTVAIKFSPLGEPVWIYLYRRSRVLITMP
jgi:hypothetical protein